MQALDVGLQIEYRRPKKSVSSKELTATSRRKTNRLAFG
jgi:hypothetical protein